MLFVITVSLDSSKRTQFKPCVLPKLVTTVCATSQTHADELKVSGALKWSNFPDKSLNRIKFGRIWTFMKECFDICKMCIVKHNDLKMGECCINIHKLKKI